MSKSQGLSNQISSSPVSDATCEEPTTPDAGTGHSGSGPADGQAVGRSLRQSEKDTKAPLGERTWGLDDRHGFEPEMDD